MPEPEINEDAKPVETPAQQSQEAPEQNAQIKPEPVTAKPKKKLNIWLIIGIASGVLVLLLFLIIVFGSPSAKTVFTDMNSKMLNTKSTLITVTYQGTMANSDSIDMTSNIYLDMSSQKTLKSKGDFSVSLVSNKVPMTIKADFIALGDSKYIKFKEFSSTSSDIDATFNQIESKIKDEWIKSRASDDYTSFVEVPLETVLTVLPTPYAFLNDSQIDNVVKIMKDPGTYTIEESAKVELGSTNTYKYSLTYDKNKYNEFSKLITSYVSYFKNSDSDGNDIKSYNLWVDTASKRIAKIEFTGSGKNGDIEGKMLFSKYDETINVSKPDDYSIESELLQ
jgi:hypothetical protein